MTGLPDTSVSRDSSARDAHREQLSAMMDGVLSADEAKFLLRRMEHDDALADCWERWQFLGDTMRGQAGRALPADFSRRVGRAIADGLADEIGHQPPLVVAAHGNARGPLLRWGGGAALAASVALAALIGTRLSSVPEDRTTAVTPTASAAVPTPTLPESFVQMPTPIPAVAGVSAQPTTPSTAESLLAQSGTAVVLATVAGISDRRRSHPRIMARAEAIAISAASTKAAADAQIAAISRASKPVSVATQGSAVPAQADIMPKPWPRALVPGAAATGEVTAGFEGSPAFQPFQPRLDPVPVRPTEDAASPH